MIEARPEEVFYLCYDCGKKLEVKGDEIIGGLILKYDLGDDWGYIVKCNECYEKDPSLKNYQEAEVYSRIVG